MLRPQGAGHGEELRLSRQHHDLGMKRQRALQPGGAGAWSPDYEEVRAADRAPVWSGLGQEIPDLGPDLSIGGSGEVERALHLKGPAKPEIFSRILADLPFQAAAHQEVLGQQLRDHLGSAGGNRPQDRQQIIGRVEGRAGFRVGQQDHELVGLGAQRLVVGGQCVGPRGLLPEPFFHGVLEEAFILELGPHLGEFDHGGRRRGGELLRLSLRHRRPLLRDRQFSPGVVDGRPHVGERLQRLICALLLAICALLLFVELGPEASRRGLSGRFQQSG